MSSLGEYILPLGTLLTQREAELMGHSIMGHLFEHRTVKLEGGVLMLFRHEQVQAWGMERIKELRGIGQGQLKHGRCGVCNAKKARLRTWTMDLMCDACWADAQRDEAEYVDLETALKEVITRHIQRWKGSRPLRDVLGNSGNYVTEKVHHITLDLLEKDLYCPKSDTETSTPVGH